MLPSRILPQCLGKVLDRLHASTSAVMLRAVDALGAGSWLTLTEMARHWPGATHVRGPLKAADRLLRSAPLTRQRRDLYSGMAHWLIRQPRPVIVVDWSDLKADGSFKLLRAGLVSRGRTITLWEE
ncbi:MAG TPA: IS4 family transposase, partial [Dyella sp.]